MTEIFSLYTVNYIVDYFTVFVLVNTIYGIKIVVRIVMSCHMGSLGTNKPNKRSPSLVQEIIYSSVLLAVSKSLTNKGKISGCGSRKIS